MEAYLTVFIAVTSLAVLIQAGILVGAYLRFKKLDEETQELRRQWRERSGPILRNIDELTLNARDSSRQILEDLGRITRDARRQMEKIDRLTDDALDRMRLQIIRADDLLTEALNNLESAGSAVRDNVTRPVREATAVIAGVKAALEFFGVRRDRRRMASQADEELFI